MVILLPLLGFVFVSLLITAGAMAFSPAGAVQIEQFADELRIVYGGESGNDLASVRVGFMVAGGFGELALGKGLEGQDQYGGHQISHAGSFACDRHDEHGSLFG